MHLNSMLLLTVHDLKLANRVDPVGNLATSDFLFALLRPFKTKTNTSKKNFKHKMADGDIQQAVVIDNGSGMCKCGFAGT